MQALWDRAYAHPDDDEARRVLADALLERGDPRGELIAVQSQLALIEEDERDAEAQRLTTRERALLDAHGAQWVHGWPFELLPHFVRGFPERQHAWALDFVRHAERAFALAPTLREIVFTDEDPRGWTAAFRAFSETPYAARIRSLTLPVTFGPVDLGSLRAFNVRALTFMGGALTGTPTFGPMLLDHLAFEFVVGLHTLSGLGAHPLRTFINRGNDVPALPNWRLLERLTLDRVTTRVELERFPYLRRLELFDTQLGQRRGVRDLLETGHPKVRRLGLRGERFDAEHVPLLERWPSLEVLDLTGCTFGSYAQAVLRKSPVVARLRCRIGEFG